MKIQNIRPVNGNYAIYNKSTQYKTQNTMTCDTFQASKPVNFGLNIKEVEGISGLFRSNCPTIEEFSKLKEKGIDLIVDLFEENTQERAKKAKELGIDYIYKDGNELFKNLADNEDLLSLTDKILLEIKNGKKVLIHCEHGESRTGRVVATCQYKMGVSRDKILAHARECIKNESIIDYIDASLDCL